jgi:hypothetical protein
MNTLLAVGTSLVLGVLGWGKMVVDDHQRREIWTPLCVWSVLLFPLWNQSVWLFALLGLGLVSKVTGFLGDGDAYMFMMLGFTASAAGPVAVAFGLSVPLLAALRQELESSSSVAMAPYFAFAFLASWTVYLVPWL